MALANLILFLRLAFAEKKSCINEKKITYSPILLFCPTN